VARILGVHARVSGGSWGDRADRAVPRRRERERERERVERTGNCADGWGPLSRGRARRTREGETTSTARAHLAEGEGADARS
jgi:hypothetical protein